MMIGQRMLETRTEKWLSNSLGGGPAVTLAHAPQKLLFECGQKTLSGPHDK